MLIDYHMHTTFSDGLSERHGDYVKSAVNKGIGEIGFSEHICLKNPSWGMKMSSAPAMIEKVKSIKAGIPVKLGVEMDFLPGLEGEIKKILNSNPFDYVIGSVHFIGDWMFDEGDSPEYKKWDIYELYRAYFDLVQQAAKSGLFDIIAHPDLIKKLGYRPKKDFSSVLERTAEVLKKEDVCIEINTGGLMSPCKEIYPSEKFLKICFDHGIPITLGSDAHKPEHVGRAFDKAVKIIKSVGYEEISRFTGRERELIPLRD
jgi:histidinol-phosphatase (PHP family)